MITDKKKIHYYDITLYVMDPKDPTKTIAYYPTTLAANVFLGAVSKENVYDHIMNEGRKTFHLTEGEHAALLNTPENGGFVRLDENHQIPKKYFNPTCYAMYYDYDTIEDLLEHCKFNPKENYGRLVMVKNASSDTRRLSMLKNTGWAIYRFVGNDPRNLESYQRILTENTANYATNWTEMVPDMKATVMELDDMVQKRHTHFNQDVLDGLSTDDNNNLYYKGIRLINRGEFTGLITTTDATFPNGVPGDLGFYITDVRESEHDTNDTKIHVPEKTVLKGDCKHQFSSDTSVVIGYDLDTSKVTSMKSFYSDCPNLKYVPWYDTRNVTDFSYFVENDTSLESIAPIDLKKATTIQGFAKNSSVKIVGMSLYTPEVKDAREAFYHCINLFSLSSLIMPKATAMTSMFEGSGLQKIYDPIDISSATITVRMFANCESLVEIPMLATTFTLNMNEMFKNCVSLEKITMIDFTNCNQAEDMFAGCEKLRFVGIKPKSLHTDLSLDGTGLTIQAFRHILYGLDDSDPHKITITNTPAVEALEDSDLAYMNQKKWAFVTK